MITALILICSVAATACTRDNAATVIRVPSDVALQLPVL